MGEEGDFYCGRIDCRLEIMLALRRLICGLILSQLLIGSMTGGMDLLQEDNVRNY